MAYYRPGDNMTIRKMVKNMTIRGMVDESYNNYLRRHDGKRPSRARIGVHLFNRLSMSDYPVAPLISKNHKTGYYTILDIPVELTEHANQLQFE